MVEAHIREATKSSTKEKRIGRQRDMSNEFVAWPEQGKLFYLGLLTPHIT
jgi:hypothetical protein